MVFMIVLVGSQKGGCGKSTTAVNICVQLAKKCRDVVLLDADRQCTAANWAMDRAGNKALPVVHCVQKYENIRETIQDLDKRYEYVVIDAAGRDSRELRTGMTAAHILLVPFRPSQPDLDTLANLQEIIIQAKDLNPQLTVYGLLTMASTNPVVQEVNEAREYLHDYPEIKLLTTIVRDRKVYRDAMSEGKGVIELDNVKAAGEIQSLVNEVFS
jgi:chromosome partitioning protein